MNSLGSTHVSETRENHEGERDEGQTIDAQSSHRMDPSTSSMPDAEAESMRSADGESSIGEVGPLRQVDVILPRVCEAIVLITQCFCNAILDQGTERQVTEYAKQRKEFLCDARSTKADEERLIESVVGPLSSDFAEIDVTEDFLLV